MRVFGWKLRFLLAQDAILIYNVMSPRIHRHKYKEVGKHENHIHI